jgi:hypothetical protein
LTVDAELRRVAKTAEKARRAQENADAAREDLYAAMRDARTAGATISRIAETMAITRQRVKQILDRHG